LDFSIKSLQTCGPPVARMLTILCIIGVVISILPTSWGAVCPSDPPTSQLYRLVVAPLFSSSLAESIMAVFALHYLASEIEFQRGSAFILQTYVFLYFLGNISYILLFQYFGSYIFFLQNADGTFPCTSGHWGILIGLVVIKCWLSSQTTYRLFLLPFPVSARKAPIILLCVGLLCTRDLVLMLEFLGGAFACVLCGLCSAKCNALTHAVERGLTCAAMPGFIPTTLGSPRGKVAPWFPFPFWTEVLPDAALGQLSALGLAREHPVKPRIKQVRTMCEVMRSVMHGKWNACRSVSCVCCVSVSV